MSAVVNAFLEDFRAQDTIDSELRQAVYPVVAPENALPSIVYVLSAGIRESFYKNSYGLRTTTIAFNIYHTNYDVLTDTRDKMEEIYHGFSGALQDANSTVISEIEMGDAFFTTESGNDNIYRCTVELDLIT